MGLLDSIFNRTFRKREQSLRVHCPHPDYTDCWVELPKEWTLRHQLDYQAAYAGVFREEEKNGPLAELAGALALVEDYDIPGLKKDLSNLADASTTVLAWLRTEVIGDYIASYQLDPKGRDQS